MDNLPKHKKYNNVYSCYEVIYEPCDVFARLCELTDQ